MIDKIGILVDNTSLNLLLTKEDLNYWMCGNMKPPGNHNRKGSQSTKNVRSKVVEGGGKNQKMIYLLSILKNNYKSNHTTIKSSLIMKVCGHKMIDSTTTLCIITTNSRQSNNDE